MNIAIDKKLTQTIAELRRRREEIKARFQIAEEHEIPAMLTQLSALKCDIDRYARQRSTLRAVV